MFFYGYVLTQLPGGRLAELFGAKWLFGGGRLCHHHHLHHCVVKLVIIWVLFGRLSSHGHYHQHHGHHLHHYIASGWAQLLLKINIIIIITTNSKWFVGHNLYTFQESW